MASDKQFRTVHGTVEFEPRTGKANGKAVRNITVAQAGLKDQAKKVGATLWPSHAHVKVEKGDVVTMRGSFATNTVNKDDGTKVTYLNLSVTGIRVHGQLDMGRDEDEVEEADEPESDDGDEIPF